MGPKSHKSFTKQSNENYLNNMSKILQGVEEIKTYDGSYENFRVFSTELKMRLKSKASIAEYILDGTIKVTKSERGLKNKCYKQSGRLTTSVELLHLVTRTATKNGSVTIDSDILAKVQHILDLCASDVKVRINAILADASKPAELERLKKPNEFYPKSKTHPDGLLSEEISWSELIEAIETDEAYEKRTSVAKLWSTHELDEIGAFATLNDAVVGKVLRTGNIPSKSINHAISIISDYVSKMLTDDAKLVAKLEDPETGNLKNGYEIYQVLSNPTSSTMKNLIITAGNLFSDRGSLSTEEHLRITLNNCRAYEKAMDSLQTEMPHSYIIGLGNWIRQFSPTDANEQALKTDVLSKDIKTLTVNEVTKCTQIRSEIGIESGSKKPPAAGAIMYMNRSIEEFVLSRSLYMAELGTQTRSTGRPLRLVPRPGAWANVYKAAGIALSQRPEHANTWGSKKFRGREDIYLSI